jgi:hypothetical protein
MTMAFSKNEFRHNSINPRYVYEKMLQNELQGKKFVGGGGVEEKEDYFFDEDDYENN